ncbi:MAG: putative immunity protein [Limisphaerales bacterium]
MNIRDHRLLARWAADCAEHILLAVWKNKRDERPFRAVEQGRAWSRGENRVGDCQKAAVAAHAAARACKDPAAIAAARCAGHAVATAHMADHCFGVGYALKAAGLAGLDVEKERAWQKRHLPKRVRKLVLTGQTRRRALGKAM